MSNYCVHFDGKKRALLRQSSGSHPPATVFRHLDATEQHTSSFMFFICCCSIIATKCKEHRPILILIGLIRCELYLQCQASATDGRCLLCVQACMYYCCRSMYWWNERSRCNSRGAFCVNLRHRFGVSRRQIQENWGKIMATFAQDAALKPGKFAEKNDKMIFGLHVLQDTYVDFLLNWECSSFP